MIYVWLFIWRRAGTFPQYSFKKIDLQNMIKESIILFMAQKSTLFFSLQNLEKLSKGNPIKAIELLKDLHNDRLLKIGFKQKLKGNSFLLNPDPILSDKGTDVLYLYQYISLAARRDYSFYTLYGIKYLVLSYFPDLISLDNIRTNPLLVVTNQEIHFKYED